MNVVTESLDVRGMSCNHCVQTIEQSLKELSGVQSVHVDLKQEKVSVSFDKAVIGLDKVKEAIEEAGYEVA